MKIRFRRKSKAEWLVLFIFVMPFAFFLLMDILHLPSLVKYTLDIAWIGLLLCLLSSKGNLPNGYSKKMAAMAGAFFTFTIVGFLLNYQSFLYYFWGLRNNARFFVFFFACICFLDEKSVGHYLRFLDKLFWINIPFVLYQFFILGKSWDFLGGIFGVEVGCNGYMNILFVIVITKSVLNYMNKKEKLSLCLLKCAVAMLISALAELKAFYIEFVAIVALAALITKFSFRKIWIIMGSAVGITVSLQIIEVLFVQFADWFNLENIWEMITSNSGYTSRNDMNRLTAVSIAMERFLPTVYDKLFGLGLGNCDYASFDFLITPFYRAYNKLHYMWFSSAFLVLETGLIGLGLYISFFLYICFAANRKYKSGQGNQEYCQMTVILAIMCLIIIIYNSSMRNEAAYMMYFVLSLPFIRERPQQNRENSLREV